MGERGTRQEEHLGKDNSPEVWNLDTEEEGRERTEELGEGVAHLPRTAVVCMVIGVVWCVCVVSGVFSSVAQSPQSSLLFIGLQQPGFPNPLELLQVYSNSCPVSQVMPANHLILWCPLLLPSNLPHQGLFQ